MGNNFINIKWLKINMDDSPKKSQPQSLTPKHQLQDLQPFESMNSREASKEEVPSVNDAKLKLDNLI